MYKTILCILTLSLISSCSLQRGYIKFDDSNEDEIIPSQAIKDHIANHPNSSIVLKAPNVKNRATEAEDNSYIYNAIEKELLLAGLDVKDRGLYNEVISKSEEIDYTEIKRITGTDLILELVRYDFPKYETNKFYNDKGEAIIEPGVIFKKFGGVVEFKITIIEGNKHGGSYLFYYTPCTVKTSDCDCEVTYTALPQTVYLEKSFCSDPNTNPQAYERIPNDQWSDFVRSNVRKMLGEIGL